jgi:hypothetical protein
MRWMRCAVFTSGCLWLAAWSWLAAPAAWGLEHLSLKRGDAPLHVSGEVLVAAADGGLLLKDAEGVLWAIQPDEIVTRRSDEQPFAGLDRQALSQRLQEQFPEGFQIHNTAHYVVCYNTSRAYAQWCGALYERLYAAFQTYWKRQGITLTEPDSPLVALVFRDQASYAEYARAELGDATSSIIGYYSLRTNRVTMYDLTMADQLGGAAGSTSAAHINRILMRPEAERTVATIIHEATHQLAFNCGLQQRYADIPLWVSEGIAVYFETPDLSSNRGWRGIGSLNEARLARFRQYQGSRPADSLRTLLADDTRFRQTRLAVDAYAEAWALNYFLLQKHSKEYAEYLRQLSKKPPLVYDKPDERIKLLESALGMSLEQLDAEFVRSMARIR